MKNFDLNVGGLIGAIACGGITAAVVFSMHGISGDQGIYKAIILGVMGGAVAGNFLWGLVFKKPQ